MLTIYRKTSNKTQIDILNGSVDDSYKVSPTDFIEELTNSLTELSKEDIQTIWFIEIQPYLYHVGLRIDQLHKVNRCKLPMARIHSVDQYVSLILYVIEYIEKHYEIVRV